MNRADVYKLIDGEREYQLKWGAVADLAPNAGVSGSSQSPQIEARGNRTLDEFALYIHGYSLDLVREASHVDTPEVKQAIVRKIAALCVACMEQHGAPPR